MSRNSRALDHPDFSCSLQRFSRNARSSLQKYARSKKLNSVKGEHSLHCQFLKAESEA